MSDPPQSDFDGVALKSTSQPDFSENSVETIYVPGGLRRRFDANKALELAACEWYEAYRAEDLINLKGAENALHAAVEELIAARVAMGGGKKLGDVGA
jgi:hypothetical protein